MSFVNSSVVTEVKRRIEGGQAQHQEVKRFYGLVKELNPQLEQEVQRQVAQQRIHQVGQQHSRSGGIGM